MLYVWHNIQGQSTFCDGKKTKFVLKTEVFCLISMCIFQCVFLPCNRRDCSSSIKDSNFMIPAFLCAKCFQFFAHTSFDANNLYQISHIKLLFTSIKVHRSIPLANKLSSKNGRHLTTSHYVLFSVDFMVDCCRHFFLQLSEKKKLSSPNKNVYIKSLALKKHHHQPSHSIKIKFNVICFQFIQKQKLSLHMDYGVKHCETTNAFEVCQFGILYDRGKKMIWSTHRTKLLFLCILLECLIFDWDMLKGKKTVFDHQLE